MTEKMIDRMNLFTMKGVRLTVRSRKEVGCEEVSSGAEPYEAGSSIAPSRVASLVATAADLLVRIPSWSLS